MAQKKSPLSLDTVFLHTAIHELKTPLLAMKLILEILLDPKGEPLTQTQRENCTDVAKSAEQTLAMVGDILAMAKMQDDNRMRSRELVNVYEQLQELVATLQPTLKQKRLTVAWEGDAKACAAIMTHAESLRSILQNLLTNAIKYNREGGTITLRLTASAGKKKQSLCVIAVEDSGVGIPKAEQKKIFGRFFRASNIKTVDPYGTGLGLFLTQALVEKLGGKIWFASKEGEGTTFFVALPCRT